MKNKSILLINILNFIVLIVEAIVLLIIALFNKDEIFIYKELCIGLAVAGIILFAFLLIKEIKVLSYDSKRFTPVLYAILTFLGVLLYYVALFNNFYKIQILLWILLVISAIVPTVVFTVLNYRLGNKKKKKGPRFLVNRQRNYK
jgi:phosphatidylserine synthase